MRDDEQAFLAEILAAPDDDTPRLIWADWLEEQGDPRAEFIRVQCAAARLPAWDVRRRELELRAWQLWRVHHPQWLAALPKLEGARWKEAFVHPRDAFGVLLFLGERVPVRPDGGPAGPAP